MSAPNNAYWAATQNAAFYRIPSPGYLHISGDTRQEYLQRQTTNDLGLLTATRVLPTILPSPSGRVLEVFTLIREGESIGLITQPGHGPGLAAFFQKHRFFNDQVTITDSSPDWIQIELHGPRALDELRRLGIDDHLELDDLAEVAWQGHKLRALVEGGFGIPLSFRLLAPVAASQPLTESLAHLPALDLATRRVLRVEACLAGDPEFNGEYTPFEIGLARLVSAEKGCYTGQEVLARQITYDKIVRCLARLHTDEAIEPGAVVHSSGKEIGKVTSAAVSSRFGALALAVLRRPHDEPGTGLDIPSQDKSVPANVS
ncbi:MAG: glycine cleavage T C-terminal barrel domain-containing protein [Anaerolineales bacterium]